MSGGAVPVNILWLWPVAYDGEGELFPVEATEKAVHLCAAMAFQEGRQIVRPEPPLQAWDGMLPRDLVFPLDEKPCYFNTTLQRDGVDLSSYVPCPVQAVEFLKWFEGGHYWGAHPLRPCLALPLVTDDRLTSRDIARINLSATAVGMIRARSAALDQLGAASFKEHFSECDFATDGSYKVLVW